MKRQDLMLYLGKSSTHLPSNLRIQKLLSCFCLQGLYILSHFGISFFVAMRIDSLFMYMLPEKSQYTLVIILLVEIFTEKRFSSAKKGKRKRNFQRMGGHLQFWLKLRRMLFGKVHRIHRFQYFNPRVDCGS
ncbi:hypothetical protein V6Z11_A02G208300 [Gossypium hirsutum]